MFEVLDRQTSLTGNQMKRLGFLLSRLLVPDGRRGLLFLRATRGKSMLQIDRELAAAD